METAKRDPVLDDAKGAGIILMVIGHCYSGINDILSLITGFHMPLFFIISGIIYGRKSNNETFRFSVVRTMKRLLIPYYFYSILMGVFLSVLSPKHDFYTRILSIITLEGIGATWYLSCIVLVEILFFAIYCFHKRSIYYIEVALLFAGFLVAPYVSGVAVVFVRVLIGSGFFAFGFCMGQKRRVLIQKNIIYFLCFFSTLVYMVTALNNGYADLNSLHFLSPILYVCSSITGSVLLLLCLSLIDRYFINSPILKLLRCLGENTLLILGSHVIFIELIRLLDYKIFNNILPKLGLAEGIVFGFIVCVFEYMIIPYYQQLRRYGYNDKRYLRGT